MGVENSGRLERTLSPAELDFAVDLSPRDLAFAVLAGRGANRGKGFILRREGVEKFLDAVGLGL
jgi:hypothetical protein